MTPTRLLAPTLLAFAFVSCASQKADNYDTADTPPIDVPPVNAPANPVYDTPAAYEETGATAAAPAVATPGVMSPSNIPTAAVPRAPSNGAAIIHTVVAGDTLSGISSKYKVPSAAIKQANAMMTDTVVLGKKMVIPPVR